jgi:uracil phosphoribosyltransferase
MSFTVTEVGHPIVKDALAHMRSIETSNANFRAHLNRLGIILLTEATKDLPTRTVKVTTPLAETSQEILADTPIVVPILRAGLGFVTAVHHVLDDADLGFVGVTRNETTFEPELYTDKLPADIGGRPVIIVDPMLATGGSLNHVIDLIAPRQVTGTITIVCAIAAPEGIEAVRSHINDRWSVHIVTGSIDSHLNEQAYIVPGLGDAGDRLFGTPRNSSAE